MQEEPIVVVAANLAASIAVTGLIVPSLGPETGSAWPSFDVSITTHGQPVAGVISLVDVGVRQGIVDPKTLQIVFLSLDIEDAAVASATPASTPWGYPTVWNLTDVDLTTTQHFVVEIIPRQSGALQLHAMIWIPRGDLSGVLIDASGHLSPSSVSLLESDSLFLNVK
ncbi:MAG: hypothetical protein AABX97_05925 [Candidatus Thermoplasmatota archaeon]